jgi:murein L,D-transpeptidase YafK
MLDTLLVAASIAAAPAPKAPADSTLVSRSPVVASAAAVPLRLAAGSADSIVVEKSERRLTLYVAGAPVRTYRVALGKNPVGPKRLQGDSRTPEGLYVIDRRNPQSKYYRSLHISYPNAVDRWLAAEKGYTAGGDVMVHGLPAHAADLASTHWQDDWTEGCVAISNQQMDELWHAVADGTPIRIKP